MAPQSPKSLAPAPRSPGRSKSAQGTTPELLFLHEVAQELRISVNSVRKLISSRELRALKITSNWRVSRFDLQKYLRDAREAALEEDEPEPEPVPDGALIERDESALAQLLGAAVLMALGQGRGIYLKDRESCEVELGRYVKQVRPELCTQERVRQFIELLYTRHSMGPSDRLLDRGLSKVPDGLAITSKPADELDEILEAAMPDEYGAEPPELGHDLPENAYDESELPEAAPAH